MDFYGVCEFKIEELEMRADICEISEYLLSKGVLLEKKDKIILDNVNKWSKVKKEYFSNFFKLIMKECFWCVLYNDKMIIKFGYDFYVYVFCEYILNNALEYLNKIFIEKLV